MKTFIRRESPRDRLRYEYNRGAHKLSYTEEDRMLLNIAKEVDYPYIRDLPASLIELDDKYSVTSKIKYSRGTNKDGIKNNWVDILVEITWKESRVVKRGWFKDNEMEYTDRYAWIPADAFTFDFSDEVDEEIIDCANA